MISDAEMMANALREISNITNLGQVRLKDCRLLLGTIGSIARAALPSQKAATIKHWCLAYETNRAVCGSALDGNWVADRENATCKVCRT